MSRNNAVQVATTTLSEDYHDRGLFRISTLEQLWFLGPLELLKAGPPLGYVVHF